MLTTTAECRTQLVRRLALDSAHSQLICLRLLIHCAFVTPPMSLPVECTLRKRTMFYIGVVVKPYLRKTVVSCLKYRRFNYHCQS